MKLQISLIDFSIKEETMPRKKSKCLLGLPDQQFKNQRLKGLIISNEKKKESSHFVFFGIFACKVTQMIRLFYKSQIHSLSINKIINQL